jgi:chromosome segregation ATPase
MDTSETGGVSAVAIDALERDFAEVMRELSAEDNLERFRMEYEKLHRALRKSHDSEKRLIKRCQDLTKDATEIAVRVQQALKLAQDDESTVVGLRKEIEKAWHMVDSAHEKELRAKDTIQTLNREVARLTQLVEQGAGLTLGQETTVQDLIEEKQQFIKERDSLQLKVLQHTQEQKEITDQLALLDAAFAAKESELQARTTTFGQLQRQRDDEMRRREETEAKVQELHRSIEARTKDNEAEKEAVRIKVADAAQLEKELKDEREKVHELDARRERTQRDLAAHTEMLGNAVTDCGRDARVIAAKKKLLEQRETELAAEQAKQSAALASCDAYDAKIDAMLKTKAQVQERSVKMEEDVATINHSIEVAKRRVEDQSRKVQEAVRDKNLSMTVAMRDEHKRAELDGQRTIEYGKNRSLEQELDAHRTENQRLRKSILELTVQREKYRSSASNATESYNDALDHVRGSKDRIVMLQRELEEAEKKRRNQAGMYDQVLADRNLFSKNLIDAQGDITEMKRKFKVMDHQIDQLKDDLRKREADLCGAHELHNNTVSDYKAAEERALSLKADVQGAKQRGNSLAEEIKQLTQIIANCDAELAKQEMKFNSVTNERNILATQLVRRNEELNLLYEKIRIQQSMLSKGEAQYRERLVDVTMLRRRVQELKAQVRTALSVINVVEKKKRQIANLQRQLLQERMKVKALFEELQTPLNVHRWRRLQGSDPQEYDNIVKIQTLERRFIAKTQENRRKEEMLASRDKQYRDLRAVLARQPGPEIAAQLSVFHRQLIRREEQLARMGDELHSSQAAADEFRGEAERLQGELVEAKGRLFTAKAAHSSLTQERHAAATMTRASRSAPDGESRLLGAPSVSGFSVRHPVGQPRFAGGGFSLTRY